MTMSCLKRGKFAVTVLTLQAVFLALFAVYGEYSHTANARFKENSLDPENGGANPDNNIVSDMYPMFQDVHVMMFIGFGFLMTFLKRYGYGSIAFNLLVAALILQWASLMAGFLEMENGKMYFDIKILLTSDFTAAAVLISFGAVLGKTSALQLIVMAVLEVVLFKINEWIGVTKFQAVDMGGSMFVHVFGAYFGITCARVLYSSDIQEAGSKEGSVYHSDLFSMIGTIFLWLYWPSFNSALAVGDDQHRAVINTYYALAACTVVTFAVSSLLDKESKFDMVHIQNSTLAGGVAVGTLADMMINPWGAILVGCIAGIVSVFGYKYGTPALARVKFHDTCGVNNLHGMPGLIAGIGGIIAAYLASETDYGYSLYQTFPARAPVFNTTKYLEVNSELQVTAGLGRTGAQQAGWQAAALGTTLGMAIAGGLVVGFILRIPIWDQPDADQMFDDSDYWAIPEEGFPGTGSAELTDIQLESVKKNATNTKI